MEKQANENTLWAGIVLLGILSSAIMSLTYWLKNFSDKPAAEVVTSGLDPIGWLAFIGAVSVIIAWAIKTARS